MEDEAEKLKQMQADVEKQLSVPTSPTAATNLTFDGSPKGFAYVEFSDKDSVSTAMALDDSLFRGRQIKVMPKRTNKPGISTTNRPPRGRGGRSRGRGRGFGGGYMRRPRGGYRR